MVVAALMIANFKEYDEPAVQERMPVDRYVARSEKEKVLISYDALA